MPSSNTPQAPKRGYSRISLRKKAMLVKLIFRRSASFQDAIAQLGIKKTTAINIIKRYKETGSFPVRKYRKTTVKTQQEQNSKTESPIVKQEQQASQRSSDELIEEENRQGQPTPVYSPEICWMYYPGIYFVGY